MSNQENELSGEALKIWNEIRSVELDLFNLPNQTVEKNVHPLPIDDSVLYLTIPVPAAYPALDTALNSKFDIEMVGKWYVVKRKV
jgi:hypothetical protein